MLWRRSCFGWTGKSEFGRERRRIDSIDSKDCGDLEKFFKKTAVTYPVDVLVYPCVGIFSQEVFISV
jgi:hypothetical protein